MKGYERYWPFNLTLSSDRPKVISSLNFSNSGETTLVLLRDNIAIVQINNFVTKSLDGYIALRVDGAIYQKDIRIEYLNVIKNPYNIFSPSSEYKIFGFTFYGEKNQCVLDPTFIYNVLKNRLFIYDHNINQIDTDTGEFFDANVKKLKKKYNFNAIQE